MNLVFFLAFFFFFIGQEISKSLNVLVYQAENIFWQRDWTFLQFGVSDKILCPSETTDFWARNVLKGSVGFVDYNCLKYFCVDS